MLRKDIAITFGGQVARVALATLGGALLARALGPDGRGLFALAILLPRTAQVVFQFGQSSVNGTFAGLYRDQRPVLFAQTILFATVLGSLSLVAMMAFFFWLPIERGSFANLPPTLVLIAMFLAPVEMLRNMLESLTRGSERITAAAVISTVGAGLMCSAIFVCLTCLHLGLAAAMWIALGGQVVCIVCYIWRVRDFATLDLRKLAWPIMKHSLRFGGIMTLSGVAMFLISRVSMYLFGYIQISKADIGLYAVALSVAEQLRIIPTSVAQAFLPRLSNNPEVRLRQTPMVFRYTVIASWATALGLALIGPPAMLLLFGRSFSGSIVPFLAMLPGLALFGSARVLGMDLWVRNKPQYGMANNWITLIVTAITTFMFIPRLGITGAAIANSLGLFVLSGLTMLAYRKESGIPLRDLVISMEDVRGVRDQATDAWRKFITRRRTLERPTARR